MVKRVTKLVESSGKTYYVVFGENSMRTYTDECDLPDEVIKFIGGCNHEIKVTERDTLFIYFR